MKVRLKPLSHPQLGDIEIDSSLFAVGRREEPFTQLAEDAAKLSRRHARMFVEDNKVYLADLQSLNGTRVNGRVLGTDAQVLAEGDMVDFGGAITFKVEIDATQVSDAPAPRMVLKPTVAAELESIVIERFPYMINRDDPLFSQHKATMPDEVKRISRRHALFAVKNGQVCLEDLDSSNGTYVNEQRMDEHAQTLNNGDTVRFGGQKFVYLVQLDNADATQDHDATVLWSGAGAPAGDQTQITPATGTESKAAEPASSAPAATSAPSSAPAADSPVDSAPADNAPATAQVAAAPADDGDKTRFVESATSFLDVFCAPVNEEEDAEQAAAEVVSTKKTPGKVSQFSDAIGIKRYNKIMLLVVGAVSIIVGVAAFTYWKDNDKRHLKNMVDDGHYSQAVAVASTYLKDNKDDFDAIRIGEKALIRAIVPSWAEMLDASDHEGAQLYVADAYPPAKHIGRGTQMLDLLIWVSRAEQLFKERGDKVSVTDDELELQSLVTEWDADQYQNRQLVTQMVAYDSSFEPYAATAMSRLVQMRNNDATFGNAISKLKRAISNGLAAGRLDSISQALDTFQTDYPRVGGMDNYRSDLDRYRRMQTSYEENDLFTLARISRQGKFLTPIFADHSNAWLTNILPSDALIQTYEAAATQWREGAAADAINTLTSIAPVADDGLGSNDRVQAKVSRYQQIDLAFRAWQQEPSVDNLLLLRERLTDAEDSYFLAASQDAFEEQRHVVVGQLEETLQRVQSLWQTYQSEGGIPGLVRLEPEVSARYRNQSERLRNAHQELQRAARQQEMLQLDRSSEWAAIEVEILNEIKRQRLWLSELRLVTNPDVLTEKLSLLPEL